MTTIFNEKLVYVIAITFNEFYYFVFFNYGEILSFPLSQALELDKANDYNLIYNNNSLSHKNFYWVKTEKLNTINNNLIKLI